jgi:3-oxoacyl-[acyl-carrier-protein] synthase-3
MPARLSHHRGHGDARHDVSLNGLPGAEQDRGQGRVGIRRLRRLFGIHVRVAGGREAGGERGAQKVLVCGADANTRMTDYTDRTTCVLFGDGGGAVLIEPAEEGEIGFIDFMNEIDGSGGVSLNMKGGGSLNPSSHETVDKKMHYIYQDGPAVYKFAVRKMAEATTKKLLERNGVTGADLGCFIPHQANKRIITATADRLGMDPERVIINIEKYGNTSAGTIPLAMETAVEEGKLKKGDLVLLAAVGAGFTVGATLLRWEI